MSIKLICGNSHPSLAAMIAERLSVNLLPMLSFKLLNDENALCVGESVRGRDVFILQSCGGSSDPNDDIMELCLLINTCRIASARKIILVIPSYPYARQDKKSSPRSPITAKLVANMLVSAGADHILTMDLHASQIVGFFNIPVDNVSAQPLMAKWIKKNIKETDFILISPDAGGVKRCCSLADALGKKFAIIHKERKMANQVSRMVLVGDVRGKHCIMVDDMADTCNTLCSGASILKQSGASSVTAIVVHPIFSTGALERIEKSDINTLAICNTISLCDDVLKSKKISLIDTSMLFSNIIEKINNGESLTALSSF